MIITVTITPDNIFIEDVNGTRNVEIKGVGGRAKASIRQRLVPPPLPFFAGEVRPSAGTGEGVLALKSGRTLEISLVEHVIGVHDVVMTVTVPMTIYGRRMKAMNGVRTKGSTGIYTPILTWIEDSEEVTYRQDVWPMSAAKG